MRRYGYTETETVEKKRPMHVYIRANFNGIDKLIEALPKLAQINRDMRPEAQIVDMDVTVDKETVMIDGFEFDQSKIFTQTPSQLKTSEPQQEETK